MLAQTCNICALFGKWSVHASNVLNGVNTARHRALPAAQIQALAVKSLWRFLCEQDVKDGSASSSGEPLQPVSSSDL